MCALFTRRRMSHLFLLYLSHTHAPTARLVQCTSRFSNLAIHCDTHVAKCVLSMQSVVKAFKLVLVECVCVSLYLLRMSAVQIKLDFPSVVCSMFAFMFVRLLHTSAYLRLFNTKALGKIRLRPGFQRSFNYYESDQKNIT